MANAFIDDEALDEESCSQEESDSVAGREQLEAEAMERALNEGRPQHVLPDSPDASYTTNRSSGYDSTDTSSQREPTTSEKQRQSTQTPAEPERNTTRKAKQAESLADIKRRHGPLASAVTASPGPVAAAAAAPAAPLAVCRKRKHVIED